MHEITQQVTKNIDAKILFSCTGWDDAGNTVKILHVNECIFILQEVNQNTICI